MFLSLLSPVIKLPFETYLFFSTFFYYLFLLIVNPSNKIIVVSYFFLFLALFIKSKSFEKSILFTLLASSIVFTGKRYPIQLLPEGIFPKEIFPQGYFVNLVITPTHVISFLILLYLGRNLMTVNLFRSGSKLRINLLDVLIVLFYGFKIGSALIGSKNPQLSLAAELLTLNGLILYFFIRLVAIKGSGDVWRGLAFLFAGLIFFETFLGAFQYINKSPLYKNLEFQVNIEYFGNNVDEPGFTYRPIGTFDHANSLGIWLASWLCFLFVFIAKYKSQVLRLAFFSGLVLLTLTISRSAWLGFLSGMFFLLVNFEKYNGLSVKGVVSGLGGYRLLIVPVLIFLSLFVVVPRIEHSAYSFGAESGSWYFRQIQIADGLEIIRINPVFGVGALMSVLEGLTLDGYTVAASIPLAVHNWYITLALNNGLPALFCFTFFVLLSLRNLWSLNLKRNYILLAVLAFSICAFVSGIFQPYLSEETLILLVTLAGNANITRNT